MDEFNCGLFFCQERFGPFIGKLVLMSKDNYIKPAKEIIELITSTSKKKNILLTAMEVGGIVTSDNEVLFSESGGLDERIILHEKFHLGVNDHVDLDQTYHHVLEEAFATAYPISQLYPKEEQEAVILFSEGLRKTFNRLVNETYKVPIDELMEKVLEKYVPLKERIQISDEKLDPYPGLLLFMKYNAYLDLGLKFFQKYDLETTIKEFVVASQLLTAAQDHKIGVDYLNSKLDSEKRISNPLEIKNMFEPTESIFVLETDKIHLLFEMENKFSFYKDSISQAFKILLPGLIQEKDLKEIYPPSFLSLYEQAKEE